MIPNFDNMTIAELRIYCSYLHRVGMDSHKIISQCINAFDNINGTSKLRYNQLFNNAAKVKEKLETLGIVHSSAINK